MYDTGAGQASSNYVELTISNQQLGEKAYVNAWDYDFTPDNGGSYVFGTPTISYQNSPIARTQGWHQFSIDSEPNSLQITIDGATVYSGTDGLPFDLVKNDTYGPTWRPAWTYYFDDFEYHPEDQSDIAATSLTWNTAQSGVDFGYQVSGADLTQDTTAYDPEVTVDAKYDGQPSEGLMGRYLQNMAGTSLLADNYFTIDLSPSLAALRPNVDVKIGNQVLTATPSANDPTIYTTEDFDPGNLPVGDTPLLGQAFIDGQDAKDEPYAVLVEALPSWFSSLQGARLSFDSNAAGANGDGAYVLSGNLPDFLLGGTFFTIPTAVPLIGGEAISGGVGFGVQVIAPLNAQSPPPLEVGLNARVSLGQTTLFSTNIPAQLSFAHDKVTLTIATGTALDPLTLEEPGGFSATIGLDYRVASLPTVTLAQAQIPVLVFGIPVQLQGDVQLGGSLEIKAQAQIVFTQNAGLELDPTGTYVGIAAEPKLTGTVRAGWFPPQWVINFLRIWYPSAFSSGGTPGFFFKDTLTLSVPLEADLHFGGSLSSLPALSDLVFMGSFNLSDKLELIARITTTPLFDITLLNASKHFFEWRLIESLP